MTMADMEQYADALYEGRPDADLARVQESIRERGMRDISVKPGYGRLLTLLAAAAGANAALEIGALAGYSGICIARGLAPDGMLTSLELKAEYAELSRANLYAAGFAGRVEYRVGEALERLAELEAEGKTFDFFFIDADKGNYPNYLDWALKLGRPGALIVADNTLLKGRIVQEESNSPSVRAMRVFNERIVSEPRLHGVVLPSYDGLSIARMI